ncbi:LytTR family DNA-binding domain-containing protein [Emticicia sp. BO119]|uniref:LytR/AlgR family response regulator transcription factor n=1 Tax=Emticicia sp. BO119 TaxID=2757768 RepID=UPI0015F045B6|nr:LytTR family transcriptional regulator DNA-binding domain-containing protein [Emticicia sp. BO119]MBA4850750.1 LytTR family transcriptional regulator DNA-binding domain-containing protein [Emticicia sp. BO119]
MTAILIDDEIRSTQNLRIELNEYCPDVIVLAECNSAQKGIEAIQLFKPDVVFLDIEMPFMNGFDLLNSFDKIAFNVVFATAYDEFALKAFEFSAIDYLIKPVNPQRLIQTVEKLRKQSKVIDKQQLQALLSNIKGLQYIRPILALPTLDGLEFVSIDDISYAQADDNYTIVYLLNKEKILLSKPLKDLEGMLENHNFLRVHYTFLVNLAHIRRYIKGQGGTLIMNDGKEVPVSRSGRPRLMEMIMI